MKRRLNRAGPPLPASRRETLEALYHRLTRRRYVHPDPVEFLHRYPEPPDRELVGLIASSLAYGQVGQILKSAAWVLNRMGPVPSRFLREASPAVLGHAFEGFKHRWTTAEHVVSMLTGARAVIKCYGSLQACFEAGFARTSLTVLPALSRFVENLRATEGARNSLLSDPASGSACKRMHLYLRWMVRRDEVDPGGWDGVPPSALVVPVDTHMHRIAIAMRLTRRKQADGRAALEITEAFRAIAPDDPVRYDFALTRLGLRGDTDLDGFLEQFHAAAR